MCRIWGYGQEATCLFQYHFVSKIKCTYLVSVINVNMYPFNISLFVCLFNYYQNQQLQIPRTRYFRGNSVDVKIQTTKFMFPLSQEHSQKMTHSHDYKDIQDYKIAKMCFVEVIGMHKSMLGNSLLVWGIYDCNSHMLNKDNGVPSPYGEVMRIHVLRFCAVLRLQKQEPDGSHIEKCSIRALYFLK